MIHFSVRHARTNLKSNFQSSIASVILKALKLEMANRLVKRYWIPSMENSSLSILVQKLNRTMKLKLIKNKISLRNRYHLKKVNLQKQLIEELGAKSKKIRRSKRKNQLKINLQVSL